jgi:hypothetical protein
MRHRRERQPPRTNQSSRDDSHPAELSAYLTSLPNLSSPPVRLPYYLRANCLLWALDCDYTDRHGALHDAYLSSTLACALDQRFTLVRSDIPALCQRHQVHCGRVSLSRKYSTPKCECSLQSLLCCSRLAIHKSTTMEPFSFNLCRSSISLMVWRNLRTDAI